MAIFGGLGVVLFITFMSAIACAIMYLCVRPCRGGQYASAYGRPSATTNLPPDDSSPSQRQRRYRKEFLSNLLISKNVVVQKPGENSDAQLDAGVKTDLILPLEDDEETPIPSCTICLFDYQEDDNICWSHNPQCQHHFHKVCIIEWLKNHDQCPCCRHNYLALSDDEEENTGDAEHSSTHRGQSESFDFDFDFITNQFSRLYHSTGPSATDDAVPTTSSPQAQPNDENQWNERLERTVDRVHSQVRTQLDRFQDYREHRNGIPRQRNDQDDFEPGATNPPFEDSVDRSIRLVRNQLDSLRAVANREISNRRASVGQSSEARDSDTRNTNEDPSWRRALEMVRTHASRIQEQINSNERTGNRN